MGLRFKRWFLTALLVVSIGCAEQKQVPGNARRFRVGDRVSFVLVPKSRAVVTQADLEQGKYKVRYLNTQGGFSDTTCDWVEIEVAKTEEAETTLTVKK